ncbi:MAG: hypothetical protein Q7J16_00905 [Candidatus Cloacimonadales bacterium]|nr:hypothetical protein [Candidatus Cloacimonadales bacterium]
MEETIIALKGTANIGKSMTIARLGRLLQKNGGITADKISDYDYRAVFSYKDQTIGIQTSGDVGDFVCGELKYFLGEKCSIIVIASKTYGKTKKCITDFARQNDYRLILSTPYQVRDDSITTDSIKNYCANHIMSMINDIISGIL